MTQQIRSFCVYSTGDVSSLANYNNNFSKVLYRDCQGTEALTRGFVPLGDDDQVILSMQDFDFGYIKTMTKTVPTSEINIHFNELKAQKEQAGVTLDKEAKAALKTAVYQKLITQAFPKRSGVYFFLDKRSKLLYIGATATSQVENIITLLSNTIPDFNPRPVITPINPSDALTGFVHGLNSEFDELFISGNKVTLEDSGAAKIQWDEDSTVAQNAIKKLLDEGKYVTSCNFKREDDTLEFKLDEYLHFSGLKFAKGYFDGEDASQHTDLLLLANSICDLFVDVTNLMKGEEVTEE